MIKVNEQSRIDRSRDERTRSMIQKINLNAFQTIDEMEKGGWRLLEIVPFKQRHQSPTVTEYHGWYVQMVRNGVGVYLEFSSERFSCCSIDVACPKCGNPVEYDFCETCEEAPDYITNIFQAYLEFKKGGVSNEIINR